MEEIKPKYPVTDTRCVHESELALPCRVLGVGALWKLVDYVVNLKGDVLKLCKIFS